MASPVPDQKRPTVDADASLLRTAKNLWGYMWPANRPDLKFRVVLAIVALIGSKVATTLSPFAYKGIIDGLGKGGQHQSLIMGIAVPIVLVVAYALGNIVDAGFQQLRDVWFASVGQNAVRTLAFQTFTHLHRLRSEERRVGKEC